MQSDLQLSQLIFKDQLPVNDIHSSEYRIVECVFKFNRNEGGTMKSVVPGFVLIRKSIMPIPRVGNGRTYEEGERDREEERKWRPRGKSDTKSKETPSQSAAPPLYHWVLASVRCHPRVHKLERNQIGIIIIIFLALHTSKRFFSWFISYSDIY